MSAFSFGWGETLETDKSENASRCQFNGVTAMTRTWKPSVDMSPAGPICPLTHLSFSFLQFVDLWTFPAREKAAVFFRAALRSPEPQHCPGPVLWGRDELHAGAEQGKATPAKAAHLHRCQCSVPAQCSPTRGGEAAGRMGEAPGQSGGWHSGVQRSHSLSRATATPL